MGPATRFFIFILALLFIFWLLSKNSIDINDRPRQKKSQQREIARPSAPIYGASNSQAEGVLREPIGDCTCGCNGVPLSSLPGYSIDYFRYKTCPARLRRKTESVSIRRDQKKHQRNELKRAKKLEKERQIELQLQDKEREEKLRHEKGESALSPSEALRRGLDTYIGQECALGHCGERHARNGECVDCRRSNSRMREAMRRGAYPRDLTPKEKREIGEIYAEARRLTRQTGVAYHVDHIKPLVAGGEHHPDNLRVITALENLKKGAAWNNKEDGLNKADFSTYIQCEIPISESAIAGEA